MFLTKEDFEDSFSIINGSKSKDGGSIDEAVNDYAKALFSDFDNMSKEDKEEIINMILNDMYNSGMYLIH